VKGKPRAIATIRTDEREKLTKDPKEAGGLYGAKCQRHIAQNSERPIDSCSPRTPVEESLREDVGVKSSEHVLGESLGGEEAVIRKLHGIPWDRVKNPRSATDLRDRRDAGVTAVERVRNPEDGTRTGHNSPGPSELPHP
jgi:hypothetical protein